LASGTASPGPRPQNRIQLSLSATRTSVCASDSRAWPEAPASGTSAPGQTAATLRGVPRSLRGIKLGTEDLEIDRRGELLERVAPLRKLPQPMLDAQNPACRPAMPVSITIPSTRWNYAKAPKATGFRGLPRSATIMHHIIRERLLSKLFFNDRTLFLMAKLYLVLINYDKVFKYYSTVTDFARFLG
jgi:hypothetical protein